MSSTKQSLLELPPDAFYAKRRSDTIGPYYDMRYEAHRQHAIKRVKMFRKKDLFKLLPLQKMAFECANTAYKIADKYDPSFYNVFSVQDHCLNGQRKFFVCTYEKLWNRVVNTPEDMRHFYEVIREGVACHLYLDVEFKTKNNSELDGNIAMVKLRKFLVGELRKNFRVVVSDDDIIELDSTTNSKFSRHLIFNIPNAFAENVQMGYFVKRCVEVWRAAMDAGDDEAKMLFARDDHGELLPIIDVGVYTRNRTFRLMLSSKFGKTATLTPVGLTKEKWKNREKDLFMASLVCNVTSTRPRILYVSFAGGADSSTRTKRKLEQMSGDQKASRYLAEESPFPAVDKGLIDVLGKEVYIRSWVHFPNTKQMIYNVGGTRYCANVKREHKSNNVYMVVNLLEGTMRQKCYDPDCRHFASDVMVLPKEPIAEAADLDNDDIYNNADFLEAVEAAIQERSKNLDESTDGANSEELEVFDEDFFREVDEAVFDTLCAKAVEKAEKLVSMVDESNNTGHEDLDHSVELIDNAVLDQDESENPEKKTQRFLDEMKSVFGAAGVL